jgi:hypothetical protein
MEGFDIKKILPWKVSRREFCRNRGNALAKSEPMLSQSLDRPAPAVAATDEAAYFWPDISVCPL